MKKEINSILRGHGLPTVQKQNSLYNKGGILRHHEKIGVNKYAYRETANTPVILLIVDLGGYEMASVAGAWGKLYNPSQIISDFEIVLIDCMDEIKEYLKKD